MACSLPGSSVHGILQARILEWLAIPSSRGSFWPGKLVSACVSYIASGFFINWATWEARIQDREWNLKVNSEKPKSKIRHRLKFGREDRESIIEGFLNIAWISEFANIWLFLTYERLPRWCSGKKKKICLLMQEMQETWVWLLGLEDPLEEGMVTQSSIITWRIPWTEEPDGLQSMRSQRAGHTEQLNTYILDLGKHLSQLIQSNETNFLSRLKLGSASNFISLWFVVLWISHTSDHLKKSSQEGPWECREKSDVDLEARICFPLADGCLLWGAGVQQPWDWMSLFLLPGLSGKRGNPRKPQWSHSRGQRECLSSQAPSSWAADISVLQGFWSQTYCMKIL